MVRMNKPSESSFGINIEESFDPTDDHTVELVDMDEFQGVSKIDGKPFTSIVWKFAIYDQDGIAFSNLIDGGVFESWQFTSMSLSAKSTARAWASALLGHELTDEDCDKIADSFDQALLNKRGLASWKIEDDPKSGNKRLKIALLRPLRRQRATPAGTSGNGEKPKSPAATPVTAPVAGNAGKESSAARRARLEAELANLSDDDVD